MRPFLPTLYLLEWPPTGVMPLPEHYQLIAGYVTVASRTTEDKDDCGNVEQIVENITRDWESNPYDIRAQTVGNIKQVMFIGRTTSRASWDIDNAGRSYGPFGISYYDKGPIRPGLTYNQIRALGEQLASTNGPYNYVTNNCQTFAEKLYERIS